MPLVSSFSSGSSGDKYQVGQLRQSLRKYLGENWVKCDGSIIDETDYPELCKKMYITSDLENNWVAKKVYNSASDIPNIQSIYCYNGTWAMIGHPTSEATSKYPYVYYTNDITGTWNEVKFNFGGARLYNIRCYNGLWLITGNSTIYYTTDLSSSWNKISLNGYLCNIEYGDGLYVTAYSDTTNLTNHVYYTNDPTGTWTLITLPNVNYSISKIQKVMYVNDIWYIFAISSNRNIVLWYTDDPTGTWTGKLVTTDNASYLYDICYHNNMWVACGDTTNSIDGYSVIWYTNDPTRTWNKIQSNNTDDPAIKSIMYHGGRWIGLTGKDYYPYIYYTNHPAETWTLTQIAKDVTQSGTCMYIYNNDIVIGSNSTSYGPYVIYHNSSYYQLPEANNTFIKVMENEYTLPTGYTRLEYIENNSDAYIDSGLVVNKTDTYEYMIDALFTNDTFAGANGYMQFKSGIASNTRSKIRVTYDGSSNVENIYVNNTLNSSTDWTDSYNGTNVKIGILKMGNADNTWYDNNAQTGKVYAQSIKKDGKLVRNYIPVMNDSGVVGLWDLVEKRFYGSATSTAFIAGTKLS